MNLFWRSETKKQNEAPGAEYTSGNPLQAQKLANPLTETYFTVVREFWKESLANVCITEHT